MLERTREACYAFRCGEGSGRLLGACGVSTAGLRAVCCLDAADAPEAQVPGRPRRAARATNPFAE